MLRNAGKSLPFEKKLTTIKIGQFLKYSVVCVETAERSNFILCVCDLQQKNAPKPNNQNTRH